MAPALAGADRPGKLSAVRRKGRERSRPLRPAPFIKENRDAAFYDADQVAKYFIKNVLPEIDSTVKAIKSEDRPYGIAK
jgi:hypothetical protein